MRLPFAVLAEAAQALGFNGDLKSEAAVRSFLLAPTTRSWKYDGNLVTPEMIGVEEAAPVEITRKAPAASAPEAPADLDIKIRSAVEDAVRKAAPSAPAGRPQAVTDAPSVKVRSAAERVWDAMPAHQRAFKDYDSARVAQLYLQSKMGDAKFVNASDEDGIKAREQVKRANDELTKRNYATFPNSAGGALVNEQFSTDIIRLVNIWGVARQHARVIPMTEATVIRPRVSGEFTVNYPNENGQSNPQVNTYDNVTLNAKTGVVLARVSKQLMQDSAIDIANDITIDLARSFARQEDRALFVGDGTAAFAGMIGFTSRIGVGTTGNAVTGGSSFATHTLSHLVEVISRVADYGRGNSKWFCSPVVKAMVFDRLSTTIGGFTKAAMQEGEVGAFLGYPIVVTNALPTTDGTNQLDALFGDLSLSSMLGTRLELQIDVDDSVFFDRFATAIRGVVRHDINVHDVGSATAGTTGPVAALFQS